MLKSCITLVALVLCAASPAFAHHSASAAFDLGQEIELTGVVMLVLLRNPHVRFYFVVTDDDGAQTRWMAEGGSWSRLARNGWAGAEIKAGDIITFRGHPSRIGENAIHVMYVTLPDGREVFSEDNSPGDLEQLRNRR